MIKVIYNNLIPKRGFAMNVFGFLFIRTGDTPEPGFINHELIHTAQMKELAFIGFYLLYVIEWFIKLFIYGERPMKISRLKKRLINIALIRII